MVLSISLIGVEVRQSPIRKLFRMNRGRLPSGSIDLMIEMTGTHVDSDGVVLTVVNEIRAESRGHKYQNSAGLRHRLDGPAEELWYESGQRDSRSWWVDGKEHRIDGPAAELWYENGQLEMREWLVNGKRHRLDGPAEEAWNKSGHLVRQEWRVHSERHRVGGPARIEWHENGNLAKQEWCLQGKMHRTDGPAWELWDEDGGNPTSQLWFVDNRTLTAAHDELSVAADPATDPNQLALLASSDERGVAVLAAHNPSCPEEAKVLWALTQDGLLR